MKKITEKLRNKTPADRPPSEPKQNREIPATQARPDVVGCRPSLLGDVTVDWGLGGKRRAHTVEKYDIE